MAIVTEKYHPKTVQVDPKTGKPLRAGSPSIPDVGGGDGNTGFFGSFFAAKNKKKAAAMEAPPPVLKASGTLSDREMIDVEVISECRERERARASARGRDWGRDRGWRDTRC
jgi:dynamin 1-like protein